MGSTALAWHSCMHYPAVCTLAQWSCVLHMAAYSAPVHTALLSAAAHKRMRQQEQQAGEFHQASVARAAHRRAEGLACDARKVQKLEQQELLQPRQHAGHVCCSH